MRKNLRRSNGKTIGIILAVLFIIFIVLLCLYLYFQTDIFKSNSQLFYKYLAENEKILEALPKSTKQSRYETEADITFELTSKEISSDIPIRNFSINYSGKTDNTIDAYSRASNFKILK